MSAASLCPSLDRSCEDCIADFLAEHPGLEVFRHTRHLCDCPMVANPPDDLMDTLCVGCEEARDLWAEFHRLMDGMPRRAA